MHNTDRTQQYLESPYAGEATDELYPGELTGNGENEYGVYGEYSAQGEYNQAEYLLGEAWQGEYPGQSGEYGQQYGEAPMNGEALLVNPMTGEINQEEEMNLAAELLTVSNEQELNYFLGKLIRKVGRGFGKFAKSGLGKTVFGALRGVAKAALPTITGALGTMIPIPGVGTALGAAAGNALAGALETGGMSGEDRDFEIARRVVRLGIESGRTLDNIPEGEIVMQEEILGAIGGLAKRLLPGVASAVLGGVTGQGAVGTQGTGGISGGLNVRSPGGWQVNVGGQAGGQMTSGAAVGINTPAPNVPFQPSPANQVMPHPYRSGPVGPARPGGGAGPTPNRRPTRGGRWVRQGRNIVVLGAY